MMYAWSFEAHTPDEVIRLVRALGKHRYVQEVDLRLHWTVDAALRALPLFAEPAARFELRRQREPNLELGSRDPSLWRSASPDEIAAAIEAFWAHDAAPLHAKLRQCLAETGLPAADHRPFEAGAELPPHPELVLLDWVLLPVDQLDAERHQGALNAMAEAQEEVDASAPVHQEGPGLAEPELVAGVSEGRLAGDFVVWSEVPYAYAEYVFRGASRAAKLSSPPTGYREL